MIGGGATPEQSIPTWLIAIDCADETAAAAERLRGKRSAGDRARSKNDRLLMDCELCFRKKKTNW